MTRKVFPVDLLALPPPEGEDVRHPIFWLSAVTALAAALRLYGMGSDLWLDEITTVLDYRNVSALRVLTEYTSSNNHLLNTLFVKGMVTVFGPAEWAIRLPAILLGIACIPAIYALARVALRQREALFASLLLAVSYHHIFFSQNGRGYTGLLFWSMLGTTSFLRGLTRDTTRDWVLYAAAMLLAVATVLYGFFVIAGHVLSFAAACAMLGKQGRRPWPLARRLLVVWAALGLLCLLLYASVLGQVSRYAATIYRAPAVGYAPFSAEHARELFRGLSAGFGGATVIGGLAALSIFGFGFALFFRRHAFYAITLVAPLFATAGFLLARGLRFSPRFFLWGLPVAWIFAAGAALSLAQWLRSRESLSGPAAQRIAQAVPFLAVAALCALSALSLPAYYSTPKQPYRASLEWALARRQNADPIVGAYLARWGLRFYGPPRGLTEGRSFFGVLSAGELESVERASRGHTVWLLTTFPRALRLEHPDLDRYIRDHYREQKSFAATIGDGQVAIWTRELPR
jgi:uncharacterized membrane protein